VKVGDLVRWRVVGDVGVVVEIIETACMVYCFRSNNRFAAYITDLEVICEGR
jgi:hypothetical protein